MIELVMTVCSIVHGASCHEAKLTFVDEGQFATPYGCLIGGMHHIVEWSEAHPNWSVARWQCGQAGRFAKI